MVYPSDPAAELGRVLPFYKPATTPKPARKAITRSKLTTRHRYPSLKARNMIDCESALEATAALFIDLSAPVKTFRSQPYTVSLVVDGEAKRYTPDFEVKLFDGRTLIIEVKPLYRCLTDEVRKKLIAAEYYFDGANREYRILTDVDLKPAVKEENLRLLRYYARVPVNHRTRFTIRQYVSHSGVTDFGVLESMGFSRPTIYSLIVNHALSTDLNTQLSINSPIFLPEENDHEKCLFEGRSALNFK